MQLLSRWSDEPRRDDQGKVIPVAFTPDDLEICKLLTPGAREPWGYQYLPTTYIAVLLGRSYGAVRNRLSKLHPQPYSFIKIPDQPQNNYRDRIFSVATNGVTELREAGIDVPKFKLRRIQHELMACIIAASFEHGARQRSIEIGRTSHIKGSIFPDWPIFRINGRNVWLEADTGSETISFAADPDTTTIGGKFEQYLHMIHDGKFKDGVAVFVTTRETRMHSMIEVLRKAIDQNNMAQDYADQFAFTHITYDRFLNKLPKLTDWAIASDYWTAFDDVKFNFLKEA